MGRHSKLTPELSARVIALLEDGWFFRHALAEVGIPEATGHRWIAEGDAEDAPEPQRKFREGCARGRCRAERRLLSSIEVKSAGSGREMNPADWKADAWLLERHNPSAYKELRRTELTGAEGGPVQLAGVVMMPPEDDADDAAASGPVAPEQGPAD